MVVIASHIVEFDVAHEAQLAGIVPAIYVQYQCVETQLVVQAVLDRR